MTKLNLKKKAIELRKTGLSYFEIKKEIKVSKSSLSLWLRNISLSNIQIHRLTEKKLNAIYQNAKNLKERKRQERMNIVEKYSKTIGKLSNRELNLIGVSLYWAEGSKQKEENISQGTIFSNSDPKMLLVYLNWVKSILKINMSRIAFEIYIHESMKHNTNKIISYWKNILLIDNKSIVRVYYKKHTIQKRNKEYNGLVRIIIKRSSWLNRQICGLIEGICINAPSSNGRTPDFESGYCGSNPCGATKKLKNTE